MDIGGENRGYIVMPIDLTIEQREVYVYLYKQCNFKDMTCKYTISQIVASVDKRLNITTMKARTILKKLLENGYITEIKKGSKGNPSVLKIITIKQQLNNNYLTIKTAQPSHLQDINNNKITTIQQLNNNLIKEKEKENNNISKDILCSTDVQQVIDKWNLLNLTKIKKINTGTNRYKLLKARVQEYGLNDVLAAIDNITKSDFLKGQNKNNWIITFDWLIKPNNFIKVLEGNYNNKKFKESEEGPKEEFIDERRASRIEARKKRLKESGEPIRYNGG